MPRTSNAQRLLSSGRRPMNECRLAPRRITGGSLSLLVVLLLAQSLFFRGSVSGESFSSNASPESESQSGVVTWLEGAAQKKSDVQASWIDAYVKTTIGNGDKMKTLQKSRAELEINWDTIIRLSENTLVDFVKLIKDYQHKFTATDIQITQGEVWGNLEALGDTSSFTIGDVAARAEIRGTTFSYKHADTGTVLKVYEGVVSVHGIHQVDSPATVAGPREVSGPQEVSGPREVSPPAVVTMEHWSVNVVAMQEISISSPGAKPRLRDFTAQESEEQSEWVRWNKERDEIVKQRRKEGRTSTSPERNPVK